MLPKRQTKNMILMLIAASLIVTVVKYIKQHTSFNLFTVSQQESVIVRIMAGRQQSEITSGIDKTKYDLRRLNHGIAQYGKEFEERFNNLTARQAKALDPELVSLVREMIDPPSFDDPMKLSRPLVETLQAAEVDKVLKEKRNGFFIEAGAYDGEVASNTIFLESARGWTGILIEMDPYLHMQILGKNRRAWSLNACLSPYDYVTQLHFQPRGDSLGRVQYEGKLTKEEKATARMTPCFPLSTIIAAMNRTHVDYLSLDVEGLELNVLRNVQLNQTSIHVMSVEYAHTTDGIQALQNYVQAQGYRMHKIISAYNPIVGIHADDFIFVKN